MTDMQLAAAVASAINEDEEFSANTWQGRPQGARVYIDQHRSRGRVREIGHLTITGGQVTADLSIRKGALRSLAEETIEAIQAEQPVRDSGALPLCTDRVVDLGSDHLPSGSPATDGPAAAHALPYTTATTPDEVWWFDPEEETDDRTRPSGSR